MSAPGMVPVAIFAAEVVSAESVLMPIEIVLNCVLVDGMELVTVVYDWLATEVDARLGTMTRIRRMKVSCNKSQLLWSLPVNYLLDYVAANINLVSCCLGSHFS